MREPEFRYVFKHVNANKPTLVKRHTLTEMQGTCADPLSTTQRNFELVGRDQWSELTDPDKVKIFENDLCQTESGSIGVVEFYEGRFLLNIDDCLYYEINEIGYARVIGNTHQNPEILENQ